MKENIVMIQSHCDTEEKINYLVENIKKLKQFDVDILLFSHIPLPQEITKLVNYFIYDAQNPILFDERRHYYWWGNNSILMETTVPDYGWTVFNQIIKSYNMVKDCNYKFFTIFCYDVVIDSVVSKALENPQKNTFIHVKPDNLDDKGNKLPVVFKTALIFSIFDSISFNTLVKNISRKEYIERYDLIAEKYFEKILIDNDVYVEPNECVHDFFSQSDNIFNLTKEKEYDLFVDNQNLLKFRILNAKKHNISIVINDKIIKINDDYFIYNEEMENLFRFGCFVNGRFDNWLNLLKQMKINKITYK
jgi:hypothetical protein